jgi:hypothetical protein
VGEVVPNSQSAKEMKDLWLYIQERLSRVVRDPALLPALKPEHLAVNSLVVDSPVVEDVAAPVVEVGSVAANDVAEVAEAPERRSGLDRRALAESRPHDRRAFGRRANEHLIWSAK